MKNYDVIVIGSGCGMIPVNQALAAGLKVALVDKGTLGGTCQNLGCLPSKMLIVPADRIMQIQHSAAMGISALLGNIDFPFMMERVRETISKSQSQVRKDLLKAGSLDYYEGKGTFIGENALMVNGETIQAKIIFIASGSRPLIPPFPGLSDIDYLTSESLLRLQTRPESLLIIGGGYIAVEYGHFFAAVGTRVTIVEMADRLVPQEEPEISALLREEMSQRLEVHTGTQAIRIKYQSGSYSVLARDISTGQDKEYSAEKLLIAVGRKPNSDLLDLDKTGVQTDSKGFILVDEYLETTRKNIYAVGDAIGKQLFTHAANREAFIAAANALHGQWIKMDFRAVPHAVFSYPQIASVGLSEAEARKSHQVLIGTARYQNQTLGMALLEKSGFAKAIVEKESGKILGFHIIGPEAAILIQEIVNVIAREGTIRDALMGVHIHPALSELVNIALTNLEEA